MRINYSVIITLLIFSKFSQATIWVGGDANCDYSSIQPALDDLSQGIDDRIYIANNNIDGGVYTENLTFDNDRPDLVRIRGGYDMCEGDQTDVNTVLNGGAVGPVMYVTGQDVVNSRLRLSNLTFTNGLNTNSFAGGLNILDVNSRIDLFDVIIIDNQGSRGGGLYSQGSSDLVVRLFDTVVTSNSADNGGGVFCAGNKISMNGKSSVSENIAISSDPESGYGGGMYLAVGCDFRVGSGGIEPSNRDGVVGNSSSGHGGGTYVASGSLLRLGQTVEGQGYIVYSDNVADSDDDGEGNGGAIFLSDSFSTLSVTRKGVIIKNNRAVNGGAVAVVDDAYASFTSMSRCQINDPCIHLIGNTAGDNTNALNQGYGGTFYVNNADIKVSRTTVTASDADIGVVGFVESGGTLGVDFSMIYDNGAPQDSRFNQNSLFTTVSSTINLSHVTITDNTLFPSSVLILKSADSALNVNNSIIQSTNQNIMAIINNEADSNQPTFGCNVLHESMSIGVSNSIYDNTITSTPGFVNSTVSDYRLDDGSVAIDKCAEYVTTGFTQIDIEGQITGIDNPTKADDAGTYDAGADESYLWDVIFINDFE